MNIKKNIFENAYFGKPYKTRDGKKVLYVGSNSDGLYFCISEWTLIIHNYLSNGQETMFEHQGIEDSSLNIVSEWQEPINEKELDELAWKEYPDDDDDDTLLNGIDNYELREAFKAGFRKLGCYSIT